MLCVTRVIHSRRFLFDEARSVSTSLLFLSTFASTAHTQRARARARCDSRVYNLYNSHQIATSLTGGSASREIALSFEASRGTSTAGGETILENLAAVVGQLIALNWKQIRDRVGPGGSAHSTSRGAARIRALLITTMFVVTRARQVALARDTFNVYRPLHRRAKRVRRLYRDKRYCTYSIARERES